MTISRNPVADKHAFPALKYDTEAVRRRLMDHLVHTVGKDPVTATKRDWFLALAYLVRDRLAERWMVTQRDVYSGRRVYYLSLEFLIGRALINNLMNLNLHKVCSEVVSEFGLKLDELFDMEPEAALGNGGLGRLAACFLDSMATLGLPGYGYGIRYDYGMFSQRIEHGSQVEAPDNWLQFPNPWEFARPAMLYTVRFGGRVISYRQANGETRNEWVDTNTILAMAYDLPVPGFGGGTVNNLRLWSAKASGEFDLAYFNTGNYIDAVKDKEESENLTRVLYPSDTTDVGRELRLKQEYFFVSASLQNIFDRYLKTHTGFDDFADKVAIQLNDTHPAVGVAELMRLLMDVHGVPWEKAWDITTKTFAYTNHTLLPEALETWSVGLFEYLLPRHMQIIYEINNWLLAKVAHQYPGDAARMGRLSLIDENGGRRVRMAHLAIVGSHKVNGVAKIHSELLRTTTFPEFDALYPGKFCNKTNGITPRRWLCQANPKLAELITSKLGDSWITELDKLAGLVPFATDKAFQKAFVAVKNANKKRLADIIQTKLGITIDPTSLFDVQVKRIHEYKRQLLNVLHVVTRYNRIRQGADLVPRTVIFAGKAAPGYFMAKLIIKLIHDVADVVNNDPAVRGLLKVVFLPDYSVSLAERIIPAADLSEQISTAGTEASGTGNMKLSLNGALTIGTMDGANIEIHDEVGPENIFIFGLTTPEVAERKRNGYNPWDFYNTNDELRQAIDMISSGFFSPQHPDTFRPIVDVLTTHGDFYLLLADYESYVKCQEKVDATWRDTNDWTTKSILNTARMGFFSSDRAMREYAEDIWRVTPRSALPVK